MQPPVLHGPWKGTLNATKVHSICPQRDIYRRSEVFEGEEDCLYLNVYTPQVRFHICFKFGNSGGVRLTINSSLLRSTSLGEIMFFQLHNATDGLRRSEKYKTNYKHLHLEHFVKINGKRKFY